MNNRLSLNCFLIYKEPDAITRSQIRPVNGAGTDWLASSCPHGYTDLRVEPEFRKLGIFSSMLRELVAFAEEHGASELILEYAVSNKEAEATWSRLGFTTTGVRAAAFTTTVRDKLSKYS